MAVIVGRQRPLIVTHDAGHRGRRRTRVTTSIIGHNREGRLVRPDRAVQEVIGTNGLGAGGAEDQINRPIAAIDEPHAGHPADTARRNRRSRAVLDAGKVDGGRPRDALVLLQMRERHEMHDDPGGEPHRHGKAERDPQPAMDENKHTHRGALAHHFAEANTS
jgi:hypothetical protein